MIGTPENLLIEISGALGVKGSHYLNKTYKWFKMFKNSTFYKVDKNKDKIKILKKIKNKTNKN